MMRLAVGLGERAQGVRTGSGLGYRLWQRNFPGLQGHRRDQIPELM
jgi:hypothetical protein